jgi:hypothetical protein
MKPRLQPWLSRGRIHSKLSFDRGMFANLHQFGDSFTEMQRTLAALSNGFQKKKGHAVTAAAAGSNGRSVMQDIASNFSRLPGYRDVEAPHREFHNAGVAAVESVLAGQHQNALVQQKKMEAMSMEVIAALERMAAAGESDNSILCVNHAN